MSALGRTLMKNIELPG